MAKVTFAIPKEYQLPEGVEDGQTFDESVTFRLSGDKLTLVEVNGVAMPGEEDKEPERAGVVPADKESLGARYQAAAGQMQ